jgi:ankyrin repeat protein
MVFVGVNMAFAVSPDAFFKMIDENDINGVKLSVWDGFEINRIYGERANQKTPLLEAIRKIRPQIVRFLLESGADTELKTNLDSTPLMTSIFWATLPYAPESTLGHQDKKDQTMEIFDLLLEYKADINYLGTYGGARGPTPLGHAAGMPYYEPALELSKKLLNAGAEVNPTFADNEKLLSPLFWVMAAVFIEWDKYHENRSELIKLLLDTGADPNVKLEDGSTPLHFAIVDYEDTKLLLEAGADKNARNNSGKTPFDLALENLDFKAMALLTAN